jgi:HEAT repeat protein
MWLGPAPWEPYTPARCHGTFRFILDYSGGEITDHGAHYIDIGQWGHGSALSGPVEIEGEASAECQQFFCRQLAVIGSASEVPALARLLADKTLREQARCALQTIPGDEAEVALLQALTTTDATLRVGIINSLGARRAKRAIGPLTSLLNNSQPSVADAAADALGAIGGADAARVLRRGLNATDMSLRRRICRAAVVCADGLVKQADREVLLQLYEALYEKGEPRSTRVAAFLGMVRAFPGASLRGMVENLKGNDPELRAAALRAVREVQGPPITAAVCGAFGELAPPQQALLLRALADRRAPRGIAAAESGLKSPDADVRIGALQLVAVLGNEEYLEKLAELAATSTGAEQAAAREALARLPGTEVDPRIASQLDAKTAVRADSRRHAKSAGRLEGGEHATRRRIRNEPGSANPTGDSPRTAEACRGKERIAS